MYYVCVPLLRTNSSGISMFCDLCVCVYHVACIEWTVEREVSVVIVSGFFFTCSQNADVYTEFFRLDFVLIFGNFVLRVAAFVPSMIVRRFWTAVS